MSDEQKSCYETSVENLKEDLLRQIKEEIIPAVKNQFEIVQSLLQREDVEEIYNAGDSGREGEYIQRLVFMMAKPNPKANIKRVWIDSQTEDEIRRGIKEAKEYEVVLTKINYRKQFCNFAND